ncbi:NUDIX domain-containing protein [Nocardioides immobilis]|uniref:NUDIX domain-containing protein n=1 Tax=Nocardioides immobilis TaxID=2049295 RepID=A0A417Y6B9_9ACTN|nr:NUDIX domain-containing protein [Nocardioides immobilis]RHW28240.1 NUDIX domain-containing protein [Nocardioides immobilis]
MGQQVQRLAAYAVIVRGDRILLTRLAERVTKHELWTLPGGGVDHGEDPQAAVVREIYEETGLRAEVGDTAHVFSMHLSDTWRRGRRVDAHSVRIVYDGWVAADSPDPRVMEIDGSTADAAWQPVAAVLDGSLPTVSLVTEALAVLQPHRRQRIAAYAYVERDGALLLTRNSALGPHPGVWTLPGGGVDHGESPAATVLRELHEECGLAGELGDLLTVDDHHFTGTAPNGRHEDFHAIRIVYRVSVPTGTQPRVVEVDGTTDAVAWVPLAEIAADEASYSSLVRAAIVAAGRPLG